MRNSTSAFVGTVHVRTPFIHLLPPLSVSAAPLYCISDALAWLLHSVVRYRRKVVDANLRSSFPDKTDAEIRLITRRFYRFLSDYFMETVKLTTTWGGGRCRGACASKGLKRPTRP